jgi:hypothetical protein
VNQAARTRIQTRTDKHESHRRSPPPTTQLNALKIRLPTLTEAIVMLRYIEMNGEVISGILSGNAVLFGD